jgi:hypothetical protein
MDPAQVLGSPALVRSAFTDPIEELRWIIGGDDETIIG